MRSTWDLIHWQCVDVAQEVARAARPTWGTDGALAERRNHSAGGPDHRNDRGGTGIRPGVIPGLSQDVCTILLLAITLDAADDHSTKELHIRYDPINEARAKDYFQRVHQVGHRGCHCLPVIHSIVLLQSGPRSAHLHHL